MNYYNGFFSYPLHFTNRIYSVIFHCAVYEDFKQSLHLQRNKPVSIGAVEGGTTVVTVMKIKAK
jgi:hypothetical protein